VLATDDEQALNNETPPTLDRGCFEHMLLVVVMAVAVTVVVRLLRRLVDNGRLGGAECKPSMRHRWVKPENLYRS
jgi:hypothetical protein